jgi:hypothetical protein
MRTWSEVQHVLSKLIYYYAEKRPEDTSGSDIENIPVSRNNIRGQLAVLSRKGYISRELRKDIMGLQAFRNVLVDHPDYTFSEESIEKANNSLQDCLELLLLKTQEISPFSSVNDDVRNKPSFDYGNGTDGDLMDAAGNDSTT